MTFSFKMSPLRNGREQAARSEVQPDLEKERQNCPFSQEEVTNLIDGGAEKTSERRSLEEYFFSHTELKTNTALMDSMSATERYEDDIRKAIQLYRIAKEDGSLEATKAMLGAGIGSGILPDGNPLGLHLVMFQPTLMGQGTLEQQAKWLGGAWNLDFIGTYAQTELGHGTFIRGLETTATYDPKTQEFVLHSPTLTAYKWWPGGLGKTANCAIVMANLICQGKKLGPHPFFVQLRDGENHQPLPGIKVGEIGPKLGMNANDNGFLGFEHHRIPREHMLMKNAQVLPDGKYVKPLQEKASYGTMVFVRVAIVQDCAAHLRKAVTIATRYSAVRRQSELYPGETEVQIMDYQTQQWKLFPAIAMAFSFHFAGQTLWTAYNDVQEQMESGQNFQRLPELHALACGLKALVTQEVAEAIDVLRRACGGHGFMASSNLPRLWGLVTAACTYEGENTVLQLQVARYLVKCCRQSGEALPQSVQYLQGCLQNTENTRSRGKNDLATATGLTKLFEKVARGQIVQVVKRLESLKSSRPEDAWNHNSIELTKAAMAHTRYFVIAEHTLALESTQMSKPVKKVMKLMLQVMSISWIFKYSGDFQIHAGLTHQDLAYFNQRLVTFLAEIRPIAVSLVDSFDIHDQSLLSTLGAYDGQVYKRMFESALESPLNKSDVSPAYEKYIKPILKSSL